VAIHLGGFLPARLHHVDLAVADVQRSLDFYRDLLGPLGWAERERYQTYRGTEEVVYLACGEQYFGIRPADGGEHRYYDVGIEHLAVLVDTREEVDSAHERCLELGARIHFPPQEDRDEPGYWAMFAFDPDGFRIEVFHWPGDPGTGRRR
jgi:catechol 2,3-dioxygenase-like lactoylglutathione lyase family enzyme